MQKPTFIFIPISLIDLDYNGPQVYLRQTIGKILRKDDEPLYKQTFIVTNEMPERAFSWYLLEPFQTHFLFSVYGDLLYIAGEEL